MKSETFSREQLNHLDKEFLITLLLQMQSQLAQQAASIEKLTEQIAIMNTRTFAQKSEKHLADSDQQNFFDKIFNEAEGILSQQKAAEPEIQTVLVPAHKRRRRRGKLEADLEGFPVKIVEHTLSEEELAAHFPGGYSRLPDEVYRKLDHSVCL